MLFNFDLAAVSHDFKMAASASKTCNWSPRDCDLQYKIDDVFKDKGQQNNI